MIFPDEPVGRGRQLNAYRRHSAPRSGSASDLRGGATFEPLKRETEMAFQCTIPAVPTIQRDDEEVKITRWDFESGAATGWHSHGWPYVVVLLTDALMRVDDGASVLEFHRKAGETYKRPAGVQHDVMNGSDNPMAFVEIEVKRL
jgi:beta-alanine degradation protein BauB